MDIQTSRETSRYKSRQTNGDTCKAVIQTDTHTPRKINWHPYIKRDNQTYIQTDIQIDTQSPRQPDTQIPRQANMQNTDMQTCTQAPAPTYSNAQVEREQERDRQIDKTERQTKRLRARQTVTYIDRQSQGCGLHRHIDMQRHIQIYTHTSDMNILAWE